MGELISHFKAANGNEGWGEWEVDQVDCAADLNKVNSAKKSQIQQNSSGYHTYKGSVETSV